MGRSRPGAPRRAAPAGCGLSPDGVSVPFFGRPHLVTHPGGEVSAGGAPAHVAVSILLLHYLLRAAGAGLRRIAVIRL